MFFFFFQFYKLGFISARQQTNTLLKRTLMANHLRQDRSPMLDKSSNFSRIWLFRRSASLSSLIIAVSTFKMSFERICRREPHPPAVEQRRSYLPAGRSSTSQCCFWDPHRTGIHCCVEGLKTSVFIVFTHTHTRVQARTLTLAPGLRIVYYLNAPPIICIK